MVLNEEHVVAENLDIFYKVGLGAAHDELITFNVKGSRLCLPVEAAPSARRCSEIYDNRVPVKFVKVYYSDDVQLHFWCQSTSITIPYCFQKTRGFT